MAMPAFDMEPDSRSPSPSGDAAATTTPSRGAASAKPPAASLITIAGTAKSAAAAKAGDLTRLFELARQQAAAPEPASIETPVAHAPPAPAEALHLRPIEALYMEATTEPVVAEPVALAEVVSEAAFELPELSFETALPSAADKSSAAVEAPTPVEAATAAEPPVAPAFVATAPAEAPAEPDPLRLVEPPAPVAPAAPTFTDLVDYWRSLRRGDDHPAAMSIDCDLVTERWPGSLLIAYTPASQDPRGEPRPGRVTRLGTACAETQSAVDAGSYATEWMLEVARTALLDDEPLEELQRLATCSGAAGFRLVALPLGPANGLANAVLCAMVPSSAAPRFGKRRAWL